MSNYFIQQVSNKGTTHPVVARLKYGIHELIGFSSLSPETREDVFGACFSELGPRLCRCWDIWEWLEKEQRQCAEQYRPSIQRVKEVPHINDLNRNVENFLYETKNFLRDLVNLVLKRCHPEVTFEDASAFVPKKGNFESEFQNWARETYGEDAHFTNALAADQEWIAELVCKRNAIEHPGGWSGTLTIRDFQPTNDGNVMVPVWYRNDDLPTSISTDMGTFCHNLLEFSEEIIVFGCISHFCHFKDLVFAEIPENKRNPDCPTRFRAALRKDVIPVVGMQKLG